MPSAPLEIRLKEVNRLDRILKEELQLPWLSGQAWDYLFDHSLVQTAAGKPLKAGDKQALDTLVRVLIPAPGIGLHPATDPAEPVYLAADQSWAVFNKDAGEASYPLLPWESNTFLNRVMRFLENSALITEADFRDLASPPILEGGLAQRLDTDTSGALLVVFTKQHKAEIRKLIQQQKLQKTYHAIVKGCIREAFTVEAEIDHFEGNKMRVVKSGGQPAKIQVRPLAMGNEASLVEVITTFGARHIVRVLLADRGFPLLGDAIYGGPLNHIKQHQLHAQRICLLQEQPLFQDLDCIINPPNNFIQNLDAVGIEYSYEK